MSTSTGCFTYRFDWTCTSFFLFYSCVQFESFRFGWRKTDVYTMLHKIINLSRSHCHRKILLSAVAHHICCNLPLSRCNEIHRNTAEIVKSLRGYMMQMVFRSQVQRLVKYLRDKGRCNIFQHVVIYLKLKLEIILLINIELICFAEPNKEYWTIHTSSFPEMVAT